MADKTPIGTAIRTLRTMAGLTLDEVAEMADSSASYISRVETGDRTPTPEWVGKTTRAIASALAGPQAAA